MAWVLCTSSLPNPSRKAILIVFLYFPLQIWYFLKFNIKPSKWSGRGCDSQLFLILWCGFQRCRVHHSHTIYLLLINFLYPSYPICLLLLITAATGLPYGLHLGGGTGPPDLPESIAGWGPRMQVTGRCSSSKQ